MTICVIAKDGTRLMPTTNIKKIRKQLKSGAVKIVCYDPFAVQQQYDSPKNVQPIEFCEDTGYGHIGVSIKSEKTEFFSEQRDFLCYPQDEVEAHKTQRKLRCARRNRKTRYRKARFDNRKAPKPKNWLAPSIIHKKDAHVQIFERYNKFIPFVSVTIEIGQFDPQVLQAVANGEDVPTGIDYQHGPTYGYDTLREAIFARDNYTCICCGKSSITDGKILRIHHLGYWRKDRSNRPGNLATVCTDCHTQRNHRIGGKLYGLEPITKPLKGASFMNIVKWQLYSAFSNICGNEIDLHITYGAVTKRERNDRNIAKSHANDAYCMGDFRPKHRAKTLYYKKRMRNNRVLEKFYDSKFVDIRDGKTKKGGELSCGRTNRSEPRNSPKNERIFRGRKASAGKRSVRTKRYSIQAGDIVLYKGKRYVSRGCHCYGTRVMLSSVNQSVNVSSVRVVKHIGGWERYNPTKI